MDGQFRVLAVFAGEEPGGAFPWQIMIEVAGDCFVSQKTYQTKERAIQEGRKVAEALKITIEPS